MDEIVEDLKTPDPRDCSHWEWMFVGSESGFCEYGNEHCPKSCCWLRKE